LGALGQFQWAGRVMLTAVRGGTFWGIHAEVEATSRRQSSGAVS
jgi:hypothetical protein